MTALEILAVLFAILVIVKFLFILVNFNLWLKGSGKLLSNEPLATIVFLLLALISGYFVFSHLSVVQVGAVMFFASAIIGLSLAPYLKVFLKLGEELAAVGLGKVWVPMMIWAIFALWVLYAVFLAGSNT